MMSIPQELIKFLSLDSSHHILSNDPLIEFNTDVPIVSLIHEYCQELSEKETISSLKEKESNLLHLDEILLNLEQLLSHFSKELTNCESVAFEIKNREDDLLNESFNISSNLNEITQFLDDVIVDPALFEEIKINRLSFTENTLVKSAFYVVYDKYCLLYTKYLKEEPATSIPPLLEEVRNNLNSIATVVMDKIYDEILQSFKLLQNKGTNINIIQSNYILPTYKEFYTLLTKYEDIWCKINGELKSQRSLLLWDYYKENQTRLYLHQIRSYSSILTSKNLSGNNEDDHNRFVFIKEQPNYLLSEEIDICYIERIVLSLLNILTDTVVNEHSFVQEFFINNINYTDMIFSNIFNFIFEFVLVPMFNNSNDFAGCLLSAYVINKICVNEPISVYSNFINIIKEFAVNKISILYHSFFNEIRQIEYIDKVYIQSILLSVLSILKSIENIEVINEYFHDLIQYVIDFIIKKNKDEMPDIINKVFLLRNLSEYSNRKYEEILNNFTCQLQNDYFKDITVNTIEDRILVDYRENWRIKLVNIHKYLNTVIDVSNVSLHIYQQLLSFFVLKYTNLRKSHSELSDESFIPHEEIMSFMKESISRD